MLALLLILSTIGLTPAISQAIWLEIDEGNQLTSKHLLRVQGGGSKVESDPIPVSTVSVSRLVERLEDLQQHLVETQQSWREAEGRRQMAERERDDPIPERMVLQTQLYQYQAERQSMLEQQQTQEQELKRQVVEAEKRNGGAEQAQLEYRRLRTEQEQELPTERETFGVRSSPKVDPTVRPTEVSEPAGKDQSGPEGLESPHNGRSGSPDKPHTFEREILGDDAVKMILIPAGDFTMGSNEQKNEKPPHRVFLDDFYLDINELTTEHYAEFLKTTERPKPSYWSDINLSRHRNRPVVGVTWEDARAYCTWVGKRLPTEAEWEKAARGTDSRMYPWGDKEPSFQDANFGKASWNGYDTLSPVGALIDGQSPYGLNDMAGNVWEWVADWFGVDYYKDSPQRNPIGPVSGSMKVIRGGAWDMQPNFLRAPYRSQAVPTTKHYTIGFRCARDAHQ